MTIVITVDDETQRARLIAWMERSMADCPVRGVKYVVSLSKEEDLSLH